MKTTIKLLTLTALLNGLIACSDDDDPVVLEVTSETVSNLYAPQVGSDQFPPISGAFTKFDFATGKTTTSSTEWDIAFRGTKIAVNGGSSSGLTDEPERNGEGAAYLATGTFAEITDVTISLLEQDSVNGLALDSWYTYAGPPTHAIYPTAGKILVIKTRDGNYAKIEILSYYKDNPLNPDSNIHDARYYTFNYVYQPNAGKTTFN